MAKAIRVAVVPAAPDIDLKSIPASKWIFDSAGHYARPDVFKCAVNQEPNPVIGNNNSNPKISAR
jgi:hypothetical protein